MLQPHIQLDEMGIRYALLPGDPGRKIRVYHMMDARMDLEDLYARLQINYPEKA